MEGQSGDCPFGEGPSGECGNLPAAMEGQSGDCPFDADHRETHRDHAAAMEGQSGDCPFLAPLPNTTSAHPPQWRGSRETARSRSTRSPTPPVPEPQWRGSRETARSRQIRLGVPLLRGRNGGAVGRLPVQLHPRLRRLRGRAAMEGQSGDCPFGSSSDRRVEDTFGPQWRGSRETARSPGRIVDDPRSRRRRNGGAVGRLPVQEPSRLRDEHERAAMEGQSGDCPFHRRAAFRLHHRVLAAMEGQSGDCPFPSNSSNTASESIRSPQWRGSRETARSGVAQLYSLMSPAPQWRGSRETARS